MWFTLGSSSSSPAALRTSRSRTPVHTAHGVGGTGCSLLGAAGWHNAAAALLVQTNAVHAVVQVPGELFCSPSTWLNAHREGTRGRLGPCSCAGRAPAVLMDPPSHSSPLTGRARSLKSLRLREGKDYQEIAWSKFVQPVRAAADLFTAIHLQQLRTHPPMAGALQRGNAAPNSPAALQAAGP